MESFDDLLNSVIGEEINEDVVGDFRDRVAHRLKVAPDKFAARMGSKSAEGRLSLHDMSKKLLDDFKFYCGEQQIRMKDAAIEDFIEFLRNRAKWNIPEDKARALAYGRNIGPAAHEAEIQHLKGQLSGAVSDGDQATVDDILERLVDFAQNQDGDGASATAALWEVSRENPDRRRMFANARGYLGRPIYSSLNTIVPKIAMLILKKENGIQKRTRVSGEEVDDASPPVDNPDDLDVTEGTIFKLASLHNEKWNYTPLFRELGSYGMDAPKLKRLIALIGEDGSHSEEALLKIARKINTEYGAGNCINLCRILLSCFDIAHLTQLQPLINKWKGDDNRFEENMQRILGMLRRKNREADTTDIRGFYDATPVNKAHPNHGTYRRGDSQDADSDHRMSAWSPAGMKLIQSLSESRLLTSTSAYRRYSAKQVAELVYLHVIALRIMACEPLSAGFAIDYAQRSIRYMGFAKWYQNATDLHLLIHALLDENVELKMPESSQEFRETLYFDEVELRTWMKDIQRGHINEPRTRKLFLHMDGQLQIRDASMKSIRRLVQDWPRNTTRQKQLAMTRLLQIMRVRARQSDLLVHLEELSTELKLELHNVNNPETGDVAHHDGSDPQHVIDGEKKHGLLATIATAATGAMLGYSIVKHLSEGKVVSPDGRTNFIINPTVQQFLTLKQRANHSEGMRALLSDSVLYVWDGFYATHDQGASILGIKLNERVAQMHLWADYIELDVDEIDQICRGHIDPERIDVCKKIKVKALGELIYYCPSLTRFYGEIMVQYGLFGKDDIEHYLLDEDASAGATCAAAIAPVVQPLGAVKRRIPKAKVKKKK